MYLQGLVAGAARIDLDGNPAGEVTARDAEYAATELAEILASREAKQAAVVATKGAARVPKPTKIAPSPPPLATTTVVLPTPSAAKVALKERPVLRLPAFRRQHG